MKQITLEQAEAVNSIISHGLCSGLGVPKAGELCVMAAINLALGGEHSDKHECVAGAARSFGIGLNDRRWSNNAVRADGMKCYAIACLGSRGMIDESAFTDKLAELTIALTDAEREANYKLVRAQAIEVIRSESKASVSLIQRRLKIGYTLATAIIDELERNGVIGPANGPEPRAVLALPDPEPTGTAPMDTTNPPPVPAKKKSDKRKPTAKEFKEMKAGESDRDK